MLSLGVSNGETISFEVYPSTLLGNGFNDVVVEGEVSADVARMLGFDYISQHANVYPTLPEGTPANPTQYSYLVFRTVSGQQKIVGVPWIKIDTLVRRETTSVFVEVPGAGATDVSAIVAALSANGYRSKNVTVGAPTT